MKILTPNERSYEVLLNVKELSVLPSSLVFTKDRGAPVLIYPTACARVLWMTKHRSFCVYIPRWNRRLQAYFGQARIFFTSSADMLDYLLKRTSHYG